MLPSAGGAGGSPVGGSLGTKTVGLELLSCRPSFLIFTNGTRREHGEGFLWRAGTVASDDLEPDDRSGGPWRIQGCLVESRGVPRVWEPGKAAERGSFLTAHFLLPLPLPWGRHTVSFPPPATLLSPSLTLRKCAAVGGPLILVLHCRIFVCQGQGSR